MSSLDMVEDSSGSDCEDAIINKRETMVLTKSMFYGGNNEAKEHDSLNQTLYEGSHEPDLSEENEVIEEDTGEEDTGEEDTDKEEIGQDYTELEGMTEKEINQFIQQTENNAVEDVDIDGDVEEDQVEEYFHTIQKQKGKVAKSKKEPPMKAQKKNINLEKQLDKNKDLPQQQEDTELNKPPIVKPKRGKKGTNDLVTSEAKTNNEDLLSLYPETVDEEKLKPSRKRGKNAIPEVANKIEKSPQKVIVDELTGEEEKSRSGRTKRGKKVIAEDLDNVSEQISKLNLGKNKQAAKNSVEEETVDLEDKVVKSKSKKDAKINNAIESKPNAPDKKTTSRKQKEDTAVKEKPIKLTKKAANETDESKLVRSTKVLTVDEINADKENIAGKGTKSGKAKQTISANAMKESNKPVGKQPAEKIEGNPSSLRSKKNLKKTEAEEESKTESKAVENAKKKVTGAKQKSTEETIKKANDAKAKPKTEPTKAKKATNTKEKETDTVVEHVTTKRVLRKK